MEKLDYCYHTHTFRCGHAFGKDEDYVLEAIKNGFKVLWFTDHIPFEGVYQRGVRMDKSDLSEYISSISALKEKYKDKIEIHIGLECEYIEQWHDYYIELLNTKGIEKLILGQHYSLIDDELVYYPMFYQDLYYLNKYVEDTVKAIRTGFFSLVAHPDIIINGYQKIDEHLKEGLIKIAEAAKEMNIPIEINYNGYVKPGRKEFRYPYLPCWEILGSVEGVDTIISLDAHDPKAFADKCNIEACFKMAEKAKVHLINRLK